MLICTVTLSTFLLTTELERRIFFVLRGNEKASFFKIRNLFFMTFGRQTIPGVPLTSLKCPKFSIKIPFLLQLGI